MNPARFIIFLLVFLLGEAGYNIAFAQDAAQLDAAARKAYASGDYEQAADLAKQLYQLKAEILAPDDFELTTAALNAGISLLHAHTYPEAVKYLEIACAGAIKRFGNNHPNVGSCFLDLTAAYAGAGEIAQAEDRVAKALTAIKATYPPEAYGAALFHAGELFRDADAKENALRFFSLAAEIYGPENVNSRDYLAATLTEIGQLLYDLLRFRDAASTLEKLLAIQRQDFGNTSESTLSTAYLLADCYRKTGEYDKALGLLEEVASGLTRVQELGHINAEDILLEIAQLQADNGGVTAALNTCQVVLQRLTNVAGDAASSQRVQALIVSGEAHAEQQNFDKAERSFQDAVGAAEKIARDKASLQVALEHFGFYHLRRGLYAEARVRLDAALDIAELADGPNSVEVAGLLERIAVALEGGNDCERARPIIERARVIYKSQKPQSHELVRVLKMGARCPDSETSRSQLMDEALKMQHEIEPTITEEFLFDKAQELHRRGELTDAQAVAEQVLALNSSSAVARDLLASILEEQGKYKLATDFLLESIAISSEQYGPNSINVAARQFNLGRLLLRAGDKENAKATCMLAAASFADHTQRLLGSFSLAEQRQLLPQQAAAQISGLLSVCQDDTCLADGYGFILPWKGLLVDGLQRQAEAARAMDAQQTGSTATRWRTVRSQLAKWTAARGSLPYDEWKPKSDALAEEKESLERKLLFAEPSKTVGRVELRNFRGLLRDGEVLADIYKFSEFGSTQESQAVYGAVLVGKNFGPRFVRLGVAADIEAIMASWRKSIGQESDKPWDKLESVAWEPLRANLPNGTRFVRVSPDGELLKLPWHRFAFPSELSGISEITEIDSPRALVRSRSKMPHPQVAKAPLALVAGDIDYDAGRTSKSLGSPGVPFKNLRWASRESKAVVSLAKAAGIEAIWLSREHATKRAVLEKIADAKFILFTTHAFANGQGELGLRGREWLVKENHPWGRNALVESGVALSGANVRDEKTLVTDGILTAEEVLDVSLGNSDLVVLSACSTGLGAETESQGLLGLRSSFLAAGARKLVMSLWNVDDRATQILMSTFYKALWREGKSVVAALQEGQEQVRQSRGFKAPKYWAGWVVLDSD
jgi:tetratricopeptide (TPR) repeat protein